MSLPAQAENLLKIGILHHESHSAEEVEECLKLRAIAVGGTKRNPRLPGVPSISEAIPGYSATSWTALVAPPGTARAGGAEAGAGRDGDREDARRAKSPD